MASIESSIPLSHSGTFDRFRPFLIVGLCAAISAAAIYTAFAAYGVNEYGWRAATQYAGRVAALLFLIPFIAGPLARLIRAKAARGLLIDRRAYGFGFAIAFIAWIGTGVGPFVHAGDPIPVTTLFFCAIGLSLLALQMFTSNALSIRLLGLGAWRRLHAFSMYAYWIAFSATFLDRVVGPGRPDDFMPVGLCLMVAALLIRFAGAFAEKTGLAAKVG
jgi:hypothetical protein